MPILASFFSSSIAWFVGMWGAQITSRLAIVAAVAAISLGGYLAAKVALFAILATLGVFTPPAIMQGIEYVLPSNLVACITAVFLSDAIFEAYSWWKEQLSLLSLVLAK